MENWNVHFHLLRCFVSISLTFFNCACHGRVSFGLILGILDIHGFRKDGTYKTNIKTKTVFITKINLLLLKIFFSPLIPCNGVGKPIGMTYNADKNYLLTTCRRHNICIWPGSWWTDGGGEEAGTDWKVLVDRKWRLGRQRTGLSGQRSGSKFKNWASWPNLNISFGFG